MRQAAYDIEQHETAVTADKPGPEQMAVCIGRAQGPHPDITEPAEADRKVQVVPDTIHRAFSSADRAPKIVDFAFDKLA